MRTPTPPSTPGDVPLITRIRAATAGRYDIHSELGVGGMATVFRATELALEREVAIKVMSTAAATAPGAFERFRREARMAAALSHPHIVPIYAIGEDPALAWFAMKFIEGRGLDSILQKDGAQPVDMVVRTMSVVGRALHHAHESGVVHRDVKPANIMVGKDGWVYVTDFGIAKRGDTEGLTQAGTVIGTPAYMSPEQFNGVAITGSADQYSLGVVAFEMLAGRAPFNGPSLGEIMRGHLLEAPPPLRTLRIDVPMAVAECVMKMIEKEPSKRFASLGDAVDALEAAAKVAARPSAGVVRTPLQPVRPVAGPTASMSPTTPIPRNPTGPVTGAGRRPVTAAHQRPVETASGGSMGRVLFGLVVVAGLGWYALKDQLDDAGPPAAQVSASAPIASAEPAPGPPLVSLTATAESTITAAPDSATATGSLDSAFAELATRVASSLAIDGVAPADSAVVRAGSQTLETVLFVNGEQIGILGGRGLFPTTVAPGPVTLSIRKRNCRDWDTTFTAQAGRRYTFVERSPRC
jgi:serine/threonine-protein kinase